MSGGTSTPGSNCGSIVSSSGPESLSEGLEHSDTHTREKVNCRSQYMCSILYRFITIVCMYVYLCTYIVELKWGKLFILQWYTTHVRYLKVCSMSTQHSNALTERRESVTIDVFACFFQKDSRSRLLLPFLVFCSLLFLLTTCYFLRTMLPLL